MSAIILDGKKISEEIFIELSEKVTLVKKILNRLPKLVIILVGDDIASYTYVKNKIKACNKIGILHELIRLEPSVEEASLINILKKLNNDSTIDGMIVQLPLPKFINVNNIINAISPLKDVDGFHPENFGKMALNIDSLKPATPSGILELIKRYQIETSGKHCVIIGRSKIVGLPLSILLSQNAYPGNMTVTLCHSKTKNLKKITLQADMLIAAVGIPKMIDSSMLKKGCCIIDVGMNRVNDLNFSRGYRLVGDVFFEEVFEKASYITPVPYGVGPMTIAALLQNVLKVAEESI